MFWKWQRQFGPRDPYGPPGENSRGAVLRVDKVITRDLTRSQVRAVPEILGDDKSEGEFQALQFLPDRRGLPVHRGTGGMYRTVLRLTDGEPIYLVVRGRRWSEGDAIPMHKIVYRYEP